MAVTTPSKLLTIAKLGSSFGVRGEVKVHSYTDPPDNLLRYKEGWHLLLKDGPKAVSVESIRKHGAVFVAQLDFLNTPEDVKQYVNTEVAIPEENLPSPAEDEYYWKDLIGCRVKNTDGHDFGTVSQIIETGANDVFVVEGSKRTLIPYADHTIDHIDIKQSEILVRWGEDWS